MIKIFKSKIIMIIRENHISKFSIIFNTNIENFKDRIKLIFAISKNILITKYIINNNIKLTIHFYEHSNKYIINQCSYLYTKDYLISQQLCLYFSDYIHTSLGEFENFVNKLKKKISYKSLRLPEIKINEFNLDNFHKSLDQISEQLKYIETLTFSFVYNLHARSNCSLKSNTTQIMQYIIDLIYLLFIKFDGNTLIINITLINIDECFPICNILEIIMEKLSVQRKYKFIINLRIFCKFNHPRIDDETGIVNYDQIGKTVFINKFITLIEDYKMVYTFFIIIKRKLKLINKNPIKLQISKFLINFRTIQLDKFPDTKNIKNENSFTPIVNIAQLENRQIQRIFENCETLDETKLILFCNNYNPLI